MISTNQNLLNQTADRFNRSSEKVWSKHPPPCRKKPGILPCDAGKLCPLEICPQTCIYRCQLKAAITEVRNKK